MVKRLLTIDQAADFLSVQQSFLESLLDHDMGPPVVRRKSYSIEYHIDDLRQYKGSDAMMKDYDAILRLGVG